MRRRFRKLLPALGLLLIFAVGGAIVFTVHHTFKTSFAYREGLALAQANPEVQQALGEPIEPGFLATGSISRTGDSGKADLSIPISGPRGSGRLQVVALKRDGEWSMQRAVVVLKGKAGRIDLLR